jgi:hypothetical protein
MSASTVNICFFNDGCKLVKERYSMGAVYRLMVLIGNQWQTVNKWDDPGHVANLLIKSGYESEHLPAIKLLNIL